MRNNTTNACLRGKTFQNSALVPTVQRLLVGQEQKEQQEYY